MAKGIPFWLMYSGISSLSKLVNVNLFRLIESIIYHFRFPHVLLCSFYFNVDWKKNLRILLRIMGYVYAKPFCIRYKFRIKSAFVSTFPVFLHGNRF